MLQIQSMNLTPQARQYKRTVTPRSGIWSSTCVSVLLQRVLIFCGIELQPSKSELSSVIFWLVRQLTDEQMVFIYIGIPAKAQIMRGTSKHSN
jgi:hypothetical protein